MIRNLGVYSVVVLLAYGPLFAAAAAEDSEVTYLLSWVAESDCLFVRNGDEHPSAEAAEHLAMKYRRVRRWIDDADEFIDRIASGSSISGRPYLVRCPDTAEQPSRDWLTEALQQHREQRSSESLRVRVGC